jgi:hypothetical protein
MDELMISEILKRSLLLFGGCCSLGCGGAEGDYSEDGLGQDREPTICGVDDMQHVEQYDGSLGPSVDFVAAHERPVANIRWKTDLASRYTDPGNVNGQRWCTATLLASDTMITAGHCFDIDYLGWRWPRDNATGNPITSAQGALEMQVDFNYQLAPDGSSRPITTVDITGLVEYRLGGVDFAVISVAGSPATTFGISAVTPFPMKVTQQIAIIQHPNSEMKQIHSGPISGMTGSVMSYTAADTEGGSSGSGLLNPASGLVHGIHVGGGCNASGGANRGVPMPQIYSVSPRLRTLSVDAAKVRAVLL